MLSKSDLSKMQKFVDNRPIDKKVEYGPESVKKSYAKKNRRKKNGR